MARVLPFPFIEGYRPNPFCDAYLIGGPTTALSAGPAMPNAASGFYQGEQFLTDLDERSRAGKRHVPQDPRSSAAAGEGSPLRQSTGNVRFGSPGAGGYSYNGSGAAAPPPPPSAAAGSGLPESEKMHILERTHNKSTRLNSMQEVLQDLEDDDIPKVGWV